MPIYEYRCECGNQEEIILSVQERNEPQACSACGKTMKRKMSIPMPAIFIETGKGMALRTLNNEDGLGIPSDNRYKAWMEQKAAEGLDSDRRVIGKGFG